MMTAIKNLNFSREKYDWRIPLGVFLLTLGLYLPLVWMQEFILRDTALRYAPMAEAFCRGDWRYAFHPRVQCLHPLTAGLLTWLLDLPGSSSTQAGSLFFFALCAFPLYALLRNIFGFSVAWRGTLCLPLLSSLVLISTTGLREPYKMLGFLVLAAGIAEVYLSPAGRRGYLEVALGGGLAFITRNDAVIPALILTFAAGVLEFSALKSIKRSAMAFLIVLFFAGVECTINYLICGQAVPGTHFWVLFKKLFGVEPAAWRFWIYMILPGSILYFSGILLVGLGIRHQKFRRLLGYMCVLFLIGLAGRIFYMASGSSAEENRMFFRSFRNGLNPALFYLAAAGIWHQWRQKKWDTLQSLLAGIFLCCFPAALALCVFWENKFYISDRYLLPGTVFLTGWAVIGIDFLWKKITNGFSPLGRRIFFLAAIIIFPLGCLCHAYSRVWNEKFYHKEIRKLAEIREIADTCRRHYQGERFTVPDFDIYDYRSNLRPKILFASSEKKQLAAYFSGGSRCQRLQEADFVLSPAAPAHGKWQQAGKKELNIWQRKK